MTRIARGAANCQAPMCLPDSDLGDFDIGTRKTLNVDLTNATRTFSTECGQAWVRSYLSAECSEPHGPVGPVHAYR